MNALNIVVSLLDDLHSPVLRDDLKNKRVHYRTRWDHETKRARTIHRVGLSVLWIGPACYHHDDLITLTEVTE